MPFAASREIAAPRRRFTAVRDTDRLVAWQGPAGLTNTFATHEFEPGGRWSYVMRGPDGQVRIDTLDAPLVAPGRPCLLDADPPLPDLSDGWHVLLHDNLWGTNFPMWNEGDATFRFTVSRTPTPG